MYLVYSVLHKLCSQVVQELTALHEVLTKERTEHELVVKGLKQELLATNNRYCGCVCV